MAVKAAVMSITDLQKVGSEWRVTVAARVYTNDEGSSSEVLATAVSTNFTPVLPNWRSRIADAVVSAAGTQLSLEVDQVMFGDFGILGV